MMTPSIFGENLFDDFFDDLFDFPSFDDKAMRKAERKLYGRHAANMMKTDVQEHDDHYEVDIEGKENRQICPPGALCRQHEPIFLCRRGCKAGRYSCEI